MKIAVVIMGVFLTAIYIRHYIYRRQVKNICRQLKYIRENDTNMLITTDLEAKELVELAQMINDNHIQLRNRINKYKQKDERLKEAITNLSHDIRTPLTSLNGYFQMLEESNSPGESRRYMEIIQGRINLLKDMLEELFTYTKLQNDAYEIEFQPENMQEIIKETIVSFYQEFKEHGITPKIDFADYEMTGMCNKMALSRIVHNMIKNSILHGNREISMSLRKSNGKMEFVCRNKVTNPEEIDIEHVFERFYRADKARQNSSTGLGLAIAKEFAVKLGGEIFAAVERDEFAITLRIPC